MLDIKGIEEIIPQRAPFLMIDKVEEYVPKFLHLLCMYPLMVQHLLKMIGTLIGLIFLPYKYYPE